VAAGVLDFPLSDPVAPFCEPGLRMPGNNFVWDLGLTRIPSVDVDGVAVAMLVGDVEDLTPLVLGALLVAWPSSPAFVPVATVGGDLVRFLFDVDDSLSRTFLLLLLVLSNSSLLNSDELKAASLLRSESVTVEA